MQQQAAAEVQQVRPQSEVEHILAAVVEVRQILLVVEVLLMPLELSYL